MAAEMEILGPEFGSEDPIVNMDANGKEGRDGTIPKGRSIAHTIFNNQRSVFLSFDIETAGEIAGIVQISAEIVRFKINSVKKTVGSDYADGIERVADTFNSYVNPEVLPEYWDQRSISVHGILPDDERIKNAGNMRTVWPEFQRWFWSIVSPSETVVLVAWNGEACDLKWLWRLTQAPNSRYSLPENIKFFVDPYRVIEKYKSCGFNKTKSNIEAYELGVVWNFANNGNSLSGAHDSLVDVKAQTDILVHGSFVPFIDCSSSILPIDEIFSRTVQNEWRKELEPIRPIHAPWVELTNEHNIMWEPRWQDKYTGPHGGPKAGPTQFIADIVRSAKGLCDIFLAILPLAFSERVAQLTEKYCFDDWVVERRKKDSDGNKMKATYFVPVLPLTDGAPTPN